MSQVCLTKSQTEMQLIRVEAKLETKNTFTVGLKLRRNLFACELTLCIFVTSFHESREE